jgi:nucleotide-binding universal stress UspA family protein
VRRAKKGGSVMIPRISRILVPTDFSQSSEWAVEYASSLAASLGARVHLVHVIEDLFHTPGPYDFHVPESAERREREYQEARTRLLAVVDRLAGMNVLATAEVRTGTPTDAIVDAAVDYGADLIVMSTHGRTGLRHLLMGSVAEEVIRAARCPVFAVRQPASAGVTSADERSRVA